jgi:membrane-bound metal-dependent hydrolase YbcI (DUF457 family)
MLAKGHALSGAAAFLAAAPLVTSAPPELVVGTLLCAGAATAPDIDHPGSTVSRTGGLATQALGAAVNVAARGHRQATHSLAFVAAATAAVQYAIVGPSAATPAAVLTGFLIAVSGPLLARTFGGRMSFGAFFLMAAGSAWAIHDGLVPLGDWFTVAVGLGAFTHLLGDMLTPEGVPLLWPMRRRFGIGLFTTAGAVEGVFTFLLAIGTLGLAVRAVTGVA